MLDSCKVGPLCSILVPALLHDVIDRIRAPVRSIHSVATLYTLCDIINRLKREGREGGRREGRGGGRREERGGRSE